MIEVKLIGHDGFYGISDVLRLFFGNVKEDRGEHRVFSESEEDLRIVSEVSDGAVTYVEGERDLWEKTLRERFPEVIEPKREIKRQLYFLLSKKTGKDFPWGSLTGIRPTVVAKEVGTAEKLISDYMVRPDKARLCIMTKDNEEKVLGLSDEDAMNVYIGVPFCPSRCAYCSFVSEEISHHLGRLGEYASALTDEISYVGRRIKKMSSLYVGGGTPTVFSDEDFEKVMRAIKDNMPVNGKTEITVEAGRPDTITDRKLKAMKEIGVQRICINPQTLCDETLKRFNRKHTVAEFYSVFEKARKMGFEIINTDLIAGLDKEPEELLKSVEGLWELGPENITIHTLYKKRRAALSRQEVLDGDDGLDAVLGKAYEMLECKGYKPYYMYRQKDTSHGLENVGFALEGAECIYNVAMMTDRRNVIALGAGSVSKRIFEGGRFERFSSPKDVLIYIRDHEEVAKRKVDFFGNGVEDEVSEM